MTKKRRIFIAFGLMCLAFIVLDFLLPLGINIGFVYVFVILLSILIPNNRSTIYAAVISTVLIAIGYFLADFKSELASAPINRLIAIVTVWAVTGFVLWYKRFSSDILKKETLFRTLFESSIEAILIVNNKGDIINFNQISGKLFGYDKGELFGQPFESLVQQHHKGGTPSTSIEELENEHVKLNELRNIFKNKRKTCVELHQHLNGRRKNGTNFPVKISLSSIDHGGNHYTMAIITDVSKQKNMLDSIKVSELQYRTLFQTMAQGVIYMNDKRELISANPAAERIIGFSTARMNGKLPFSFVNKTILPDGSELPFEKHPGMIAMSTGKEVRDFVMGVYNPKKKDYVWISKNAIPQFRPGEKTPYQVFATFVDITERKEAQDKLEELNQDLERRVEERSRAFKESQEMYKMIARNFPNGVMNVLNKDLNYIFAEGIEMYRKGITSETLIGTSFIDRINPEIQDEIKEQLLSVFDGKDVDFELKTEGRTYMVYAVGLYNKTNKIDHILMVSQNITGLKKAEEHTNRALEKERNLNELKSRFVSMASHEFRTPLTTTLNSLNLLSKYIEIPGSKEKQEKHITRIKAAVSHLTNTLNDFLSIDKLEEGKVNIRYSHFNLTEFVEEAIEDMKGLIKPDQQIVHTHRGTTEVCLDKMMLKNIYNNLLSNAVKYSPERSTVTIDTTIQDDWFTVIIKDNGIGIPAEDQHHLFERFFRANNALELQGTGLGLNIIKKYTEILNGDISFVSTINEGSVFTVKLPIPNQHCSKN